MHRIYRKTCVFFPHHIKKQEKVYNATVNELRATAEEFVKSDNSLKFPHVCVLYIIIVGLIESIRKTEICIIM